ncbi:unnamed protein product, partial [Choristocarpus tenellus]
IIAFQPLCRIGEWRARTPLCKGDRTGRNFQCLRHNIGYTRLRSRWWREFIVKAVDEGKDVDGEAVTESRSQGPPGPIDGKVAESQPTNLRLGREETTLELCKKRLVVLQRKLRQVKDLIVRQAQDPSSLDEAQLRKIDRK